MQENKTAEKVKIAVVGPDAAEVVASLAGTYPDAELVPMERAPTDMPYVFADPELQARKTEADRRRRRIESPDPTEPIRTMNRRERRRLAALSRGAKKR